MGFYVAQPEDTNNAIQEYINQFNDSRFFLDKKSRLLDTFVNSLKTIPITTGETFYRGRLLDEGKSNYESKDLQAPPENLVGVGRLNPRRIRYLYVTEHDYTAAAELRPWISAVVGIATAIPKYDFEVLDFVPTQEERERKNSYKRQLSEMFSRPVRPNIADVEYLATQSIAEYVKQRGIGGIRYQSAVDPKGVNYCLFDPECMEITFSHYLQINNVEYGITKAP
ncbi:RES family NAD+ phosphorylase [Paenibacillus sp. FSL R10-2748]|uniref:RES family NAD+ phosphorylase n=1 Tax=Paenibacillus sp. FSL R10-2748 TaxID=2954658 RepID=UPI0030F80DD9